MRDFAGLCAAVPKELKRKGYFAKHIANAITLLRILLAAAMLFVPPFSVRFWACYLGAGLSDIFDGVVARKCKQQSDFGAKLDSIADLLFACAIAAVMIEHIPFPAWLWIGGACIALLRGACYAVGYIKYRTFSSVHTYANKAAGAIIFLFPLLYRLLGIEASGILACTAAFVSALEEFLIIIRSGQLNREQRSLFSK